MKIIVLGAGTWGTTLAKVLDQNLHSVTLWHYRKDFIEQINKNRYHSKLNIKISKSIHLTSNLKEFEKFDMAVIAVPSQSIREVLNKVKIIHQDLIIVNASKGIEVSSLNTVSKIIENITLVSKNNIVALYGPSHAEEVAKEIPTTIVAACVNIDTARITQDVFSNHYFRIYSNDDIIGVEIGGAVKNIIAIAAGITIGVGYGDNTISALITRGIAEIKRLGIKMGAKEKTFLGLSGIGDLIVTATSTHSRNRKLGFELGKGKKINKVIEDMGMVVEGVQTSKAIYKLAKKMDVEMPICNNVYQILFNQKNPTIAIKDLMNRKLIDE